MFQEVLKITIDKATKTNGNPMQIFIQEIQNYHDRPAHSLEELKDKNTKLKGDIFEAFCKKYLQKKYESVWLLKEIPVVVLNQIGMIGSDFGIDIIVRDTEGKFSAVQCKYRNRDKKSSQVTWKELSTFYALCARLESNGNFKFKNHIVISTADSCRRIGKKTSQDLSICYKTLCNLKLMDFIEMQDKAEPVPVKPISADKERMINARLKFLENLGK